MTVRELEPAEVYFRLGEVLAQGGREEAAGRHLSAAAAAGWPEAEARRVLGVAALYGGDDERAETEFRRAIEADRLGSIILYGPPGCGKTSLAEVIARGTERHFERTSGVLANVATLRSRLEAAEQRKRFRKRETILFID